MKPPVSSTRTPSTIALEPTDWHWATWRKLPPLKLEKPATDPEDDARRLDLPRGSRKSPREQLARMFRYLSHREVSPLVVRTMRDLFSPKAVVEAFLANPPKTNGYDGGGNVLNGLRSHVMPYLTKTERAALRKRIASKTKRDALKFPLDDYYYQVSGELLVATMLGGFDDELTLILSKMPDDHYRGKYAYDSYQLPQVLIFGLADPKEVERHMRRLQLRLNEPHFVRAWLAHTELRALDYIEETIRATKSKKLSTALASVLALVKHPPKSHGRRSR